MNFPRRMRFDSANAAGREVAEGEKPLPRHPLDVRLRPRLVHEPEGAAVLGRDELAGKDEVGGDEVSGDETKELVAVVGVRHTEEDLGLPDQDAAVRRVTVVAGEEQGHAGAGGVALDDADDRQGRIEQGEDEPPELEEHLADAGARLPERPVEVDPVAEELVAAAKHRPARIPGGRLDRGRELLNDRRRQRVGVSVGQADPCAAGLAFERDVCQVALRRFGPRCG